MPANTDNSRMREFQSKNRQSQFAAFLRKTGGGLIVLPGRIFLSETQRYGVFNRSESFGKPFDKDIRRKFVHQQKACGKFTLRAAKALILCGITISYKLRPHWSGFLWPAG